MVISHSGCGDAMKGFQRKVLQGRIAHSFYACAIVEVEQVMQDMKKYPGEGFLTVILTVERYE